ncbi:MAG: cyclodeaminase/cyclohydrolase family protein [Candidatus Omnitrophota bacterium]
MRKLKNHTIDEFLTALSRRQPTPGGGCCAALTAASGAGLLAMVARYSLGRSQSRRREERLKKIVADYDDLRKALTALIDEDALAYQQVVKMRGKSAGEKDRARRAAAKVPSRVAQLCRRAMKHAVYLVKNGNPHLLSDVEVGAELLFAAYRSALINVKVNQS